MFIKKLIGIVLLLLCVSSCAFGADSIVGTSLRKTSDNNVNLTFYTKGDSAERPIVKDKGNNNYVILLPNYSNSSRTPDLKSVSDLVSNIEVKTISEGAVTYTKVSLTSKKPISVRADLKKTSQSISDLSGVNDIVSRVNLINQDIKETKNIAVAPSLPQSVQQVKNITTPVVAKKEAEKPVATVTNLQPVAKPKVEKPKVEKTVEKAPKQKIEKTIVKENKPANKKVEQKPPVVVQKVETPTQEPVVENIENIELPTLENIDIAETINETPVAPEPKQNILKKYLKSPLALISLLIIGGLLLVMAILRKIGGVLQKNDISYSLLSDLNTAISTEAKRGRMNNEPIEGNWQEKYHTFKTGEKMPHNVVTETELDIVDDDKYIEEADIQDENLFATGIYDEGNSISSSMKRSLKSFADGRGLYGETRRNNGISNRLKSFENNPITNLDRNIQELLNTIIEVEEEKSAVQDTVITIPQKEVSNAQEKENITQETVASKTPKAVTKKNSTSPIEKKAQKGKMKIMQSRMIDEARGFYLVDMQDKLALMGRINEKFTVLKKFNNMNKKTLQVRRDKDNLYLVRTDGFKALVDVSENKMGVLAEL